MKRLTALLIFVLMGLTPAALADPDMTGGVDGGTPSETSHSHWTANNGETYECLEWSDDMGCRTGITRTDPETGYVEEMWVAPSGRIYWLPGTSGSESRWIPPPPGEEEERWYYQTCVDG